MVAKESPQQPHVAENDEQEAREGLEYLLGGISLDDVGIAAFEGEEVVLDDSKGSPTLTNSPASSPKASTEKESDMGLKLDLKNSGSFVVDNAESDRIMERAHACTPSVCGGRFLQHSVAIMDLSNFHRGNGLVAIRKIQRGTVIYTENAAFSVQTPTRPKSDDDPGTGSSRSWTAPSVYPMRACQNCFRSMEPVTSCSVDGSEMPLSTLWPNPPFEGEKHGNLEESYRSDDHGRQQCKSCQALFCTGYCRRQHISEVEDCCNVTKAIQTAVETYPSSLSEPSLLLGARVLVSVLASYRKTGDVMVPLLGGMCGDPSDITLLELGDQVRLEDDSVGYSVQGVYRGVADVLAMTEVERQLLPLNLFERLVALSARNGFLITTQSPFRQYHSALLRAAGGRNTEKHSRLVADVARALGSTSGTLQRGMDREVEERCAVTIVTLYTLTARINHSCDPNAEVRSQEYVDNYIDLVATRDIAPGEEITISYLDVGPSAGRKDRASRMRALKARYLFDCRCVRCRTQETSLSG